MSDLFLFSHYETIAPWFHTKAEKGGFSFACKRCFCKLKIITAATRQDSFTSKQSTLVHLFAVNLLCCQIKLQLTAERLHVGLDRNSPAECLAAVDMDLLSLVPRKLL